jgi:hypothetical protein
VLQEGATLRNAIIGPDQIEGVYCLGACTIENVWWEKVCEDALSLKEGSGPYNVIGGGAQGAEDKVIQVCFGALPLRLSFSAIDCVCCMGCGANKPGIAQLRRRSNHRWLHRLRLWETLPVMRNLR